MDPEREKIIYAIEHGLCPECCTELDMTSKHERDMSNDDWYCPKCGWVCWIGTWDKVKEEENLEWLSKAED